MSTAADFRVELEEVTYVLALPREEKSVFLSPTSNQGGTDAFNGNNHIIILYISS